MMSMRRPPADAAASVGGSTAAALANAAAALAAASETPRLDAEVLLAFVMGRTRSSLRAFPERALDRDAAARFDALVERRAHGEPVAYLVGQREFFSLPLAVSAAVLIPRPETELLVELALAAVECRERPAILDAGTGSGAIALALKSARRDADVTASDVSAAALAVAGANAARLELAVRFVKSAWFARLGAQTFDVIVSNPPYLASAEITGALDREPRLALDGGADGLDAYRALLDGAAAHLNACGVLLLEHGSGQRAALTALAAAKQWRVAAAHDDLAGHARVLALEPGGAP